MNRDKWVNFFTKALDHHINSDPMLKLMNEISMNKFMNPPKNNAFPQFIKKVPIRNPKSIHMVNITIPERPELPEGIR